MSLARTEELAGFFRSAGKDNIPQLGNEVSQTTACGERFDTDISRKPEGFVAKSFQHSVDHLRPRLNGVGRRFVHWQCRSNTLG